jgi:hypothetical protein
MDKKIAYNVFAVVMFTVLICNIIFTQYLNIYNLHIPTHSWFIPKDVEEGYKKFSPRYPHFTKV